MVCSRGLAWLAVVAVVAVVTASPVMGQVTEVVIGPPTVVLTTGQQQGVFATAYDRTGNAVSTAQFTWRSSNPNVARVEPDNSSPGGALVIAVGPGLAQIEARTGNVSGTAAVQVQGGAVGAAIQVGSGDAGVLRIEPPNILMLPSEQRQLIPLFLRNDGEPATPQRVSWQSLNPAIANVNDAGLVVAVSEGQAAIQATSANGLTAIAPLSVSRASFGFTRAIVSMSPGEEQTVEVVVPTQSNRIIQSTLLSWRTSNPAVVTVNQLGLLRAAGAGSAQIVASAFLQEQVLEVRVHRPVTTMELRPGPSSGPVVVPFSGAVTFEARALAADGTPVPDAPMLWTVADTTIARFDGATRQIHGLQLGSTRLHLRGPGPDVLEASWDVRVVAGGLAIAPRRRGLGVRDTLALGAQFTDSDGVPISPASGHAWTTSDQNVAQVTGGGLVTAVGRGHAAIIAATSWGAADTAHVFVQGELLFAATRGGSVNIWAVDRGTPGQATQVTTDPGAEVAPAYSPGGSQIAFVSTRDGNAELYVSDADGSNARRLTQTAGAEDAPGWSHDGRQIYFAGAEAAGRAQIFVINVDGTGRRALTQDPAATNFQPAVSPDGSRIAFTSTRDGNYEIYLMDADGSNQRNVTQSPGKEGIPQWYTDDQLGFLAETRSGSNLQSVVMRRQLSSGQQAPVSPAGLMVTDFAVSRDGQVLALQVERFGDGGSIVRRLFLMALSGGSPIELPAATADEQQLSPGWR